MRYNISKATAPAMSTLGKGTECIKILLSQASKDMHEPLVPMFFPHYNGVTVLSKKSRKVGNQPDNHPLSA